MRTEISLCQSTFGAGAADRLIGCQTICDWRARTKRIYVIPWDLWPLFSLLPSSPHTSSFSIQIVNNKKMWMRAAHGYVLVFSIIGIALSKIWWTVTWKPVIYLDMNVGHFQSILPISFHTFFFSFFRFDIRCHFGYSNNFNSVHADRAFCVPWKVDNAQSTASITRESFIN